MSTILLATTKLSKDHGTPDESTRKKHPFLFLFWVSKKEKSPFVAYYNSISRNRKWSLIDVAF